MGIIIGVFLVLAGVMADKQVAKDKEVTITKVTITQHVDK